MALNIRLQSRRDTATNWEATNPVLLDGELIIVTTNTGDIRFKIGDGVKTYTQLPFQDETLQSTLNGVESIIDQKTQVQIITWEADD